MVPFWPLIWLVPVDSPAKIPRIDVRNESISIRKKAGSHK